MPSESLDGCGTFLGPVVSPFFFRVGTGAGGEVDDRSCSSTTNSDSVSGSGVGVAGLFCTVFFFLGMISRLLASTSSSTGEFSLAGLGVGVIFCFFFLGELPGENLGEAGAGASSSTKETAAIGRSLLP